MDTWLGRCPVPKESRHRHSFTALAFTWLMFAPNTYYNVHHALMYSFALRLAEGIFPSLVHLEYLTLRDYRGFLLPSSPSFLPWGFDCLVRTCKYDLQLCSTYLRSSLLSLYLCSCNLILLESNTYIFYASLFAPCMLEALNVDYPVIMMVPLAIQTIFV